MRTSARHRRLVGASLLCAGSLAATVAVAGGTVTSPVTASAAVPAATTPIQHLVVIFQENVSFDHYFGTYPNATNTSGEPFQALPNTPTVNGLTQALLTANPNGVNPRRLDPSNINDVLTCDQDHNYTAEQQAFDNGAMDKFPTSVGTSMGNNPNGQGCQSSDVMNYYDGNTVTGLWNYAQHFAMSDNSFGTTFGPSAPGAINLVSGDTGGVGQIIRGATSDVVADGEGGFSLINDAQGYYDDCSSRDSVSMTGQNIGDLLNTAGLSWGWFQGGFRPTTPYPTGTATAPYNPLSTTRAACNASHPVGPAVGGNGQYGSKSDYIAHHEPFQYYATTANPHHLAPASLASIGTDTQTFVAGAPQFDTANHQYDTSDFDALVGAIAHGQLTPDHLPAVSFLKAPGYEDGHADYSDPLDEQQFVTNEINALEQTPDWSSTAVIISYDDSDGFYDHVYSGVTNPSASSADVLTGTGLCGSGTPLAGENGRCGLGPRLPLLVISPYAKANFVDHTQTDQTSITRFIEDNWGLARIAGSYDAVSGSLNNMFDFSATHTNPPLVLNPTTGQPTAPPPPPPPACSGLLGCLLHDLLQALGLGGLNLF
jgi:phospholipase C